MLRYTVRSNRNKRARFDAGYGKRALAAAQVLEYRLRSVCIKGSCTDLGCNTVSSVECTLGDLRYYIVTLLLQSSLVRKCSRARASEKSHRIEARKLEIMIASGKKRGPFEKREIGLRGRTRGLFPTYSIHIYISVRTDTGTVCDPTRKESLPSADSFAYPG